MKQPLLFYFVVNKANKTIHVKRSFDAEKELVWDAWTKSELLDQWWAPKPYHVETQSMDFREGGAWFYAMVSPENVAHHCRNDYQKIQSGKMFVSLDAFCDDKGNIDVSMPRTEWTNTFSEQDGVTTVNIQLQFTELADLEKILEMGFKEGFTMGLGNLDELLAKTTA